MAVDDVSLEVARGDVLCLLGPSGCGKSTTLRIAAGLERPDSGLVHIGGRLVEGLGRHEPPERRKVGLMFQDYALFPHLSVKANVAFGLAGLSRAERRSRTERELARVGLSNFRDAYPHTLSGGEQQRVALARMLAPEPLVVLLDEPFSGLDATFRDELRAATIRRLKDFGAAVVMVTHDVDEALRVGDRIAVMREGAIIQTGSPGELYGRPADLWIAQLFGGVNLFHARVVDGAVALPFGKILTKDVAEGAWVEIVYRPAAIHLAQTGIRARVLAVRPCAAGLEIEAAIDDPSHSPLGVEMPAIVKAAAPYRAAVEPGADICLAAQPEDALVFPCRDTICRA